MFFFVFSRGFPFRWKRSWRCARRIRASFSSGTRELERVATGVGFAGFHRHPEISGDRDVPRLRCRSEPWLLLTCPFLAGGPPIGWDPWQDARSFPACGRRTGNPERNWPWASNGIQARGTRGSRLPRQSLPGRDRWCIDVVGVLKTGVRGRQPPPASGGNGGRKDRSFCVRSQDPFVASPFVPVLGKG